MLEQWTLFEWLDATLKEAHRVEARANALRDDKVSKAFIAIAIASLLLLSWNERWNISKKSFPVGFRN